MGLCSLPAIYLGPNYGGGNVDNGDLFQKIPCIYCYTQCLDPCSRPPPTHTSAGDSWTLTGKSRSVSCGITAPFSWVLVHKVLFVPSKSLFPNPVYVLEALWGGLLSFMAFNMLRYIPSMPTFWRFFFFLNHEWVLNFVRSFFVSIEVIIWFLFSLMMWYGVSYWFVDIERSLHLWVISHLTLVYGFIFNALFDLVC